MSSKPKSAKQKAPASQPPVSRPTPAPKPAAVPITPPTVAPRAPATPRAVTKPTATKAALAPVASKPAPLRKPSLKVPAPSPVAQPKTAKGRRREDGGSKMEAQFHAPSSILHPPTPPSPSAPSAATPPLSIARQSIQPGNLKPSNPASASIPVKKSKRSLASKSAPKSAPVPPPAPAKPVAAAPAPVVPAAKPAPAPQPAPVKAAAPAAPAKPVSPAPAPAKPVAAAPAPVVPAAKPVPAPQPAPVKAAAPAPAKPVAAAPAPVVPAAKPAPAPQPAPAKAAAPAAPAKPVAPEPAPAKPKAGRKGATKAKSSIPPILLEGDETPTPSVSGPGQRYALGPSAAPAQPADTEAGDLPEAYGTKRLLLTARDPQWLYAHWDLTREQQKEYNQLSADGHLVLRAYVGELGGELASEVEAHPESRHWFVHVGRGGTKYVAELGYYAFGGKWVRISTSTGTLTPPDTLSDDTSIEFATLPVGLPLPKLVALVKELAMEHLPLVQAILELRAAGHVELPGPTIFQTHAWTPEQERALMQVVNIDTVRRVWIGSLEITELIRRKLLGELSSQAAAGLAAVTSPAVAFGGVSSVSSPFGGGEQKAKGFWFNVNAELVIYGATEPDATVTIGGREIKLRRDGSFSYRFALPDGQYPLPAVATSADGTDARWADLHFSRSTSYGGEVGVHPQDAALKPPKAQSL